MQSLNSMLFRVRPAIPMAMQIPKQVAMMYAPSAAADTACEDAEETIASAPEATIEPEEAAAEVTPESEPEQEILSEPTSEKPAGSSLLQGPMTMRKAMILKEILDKPLALRRR